MKKVLGLIGFCLVVIVGMNLFAENRPHDQIMKDVNATFAALKKNIDSSMAVEAQQDAMKLSGLFKEVEVFWAPLRSKNALEAARTLQAVADEVASAAQANDLKRAGTLYGGIAKTCKACHDRHRVQMPDKAFKIRP
jgi:cytochrome c556